MSFLWPVRFGLAIWGLTLITLFVLSFLSSPSFSRVYFPYRRFFLFILFRPIPRLLSPLIVSLPLYSSYSSMFRLLPYLWTYFTLLSLVYSRSTVVIYIFFALRPLMYRRFIGLSIVNSIYNVLSIHLKLIKRFFNIIHSH